MLSSAADHLSQKRLVLASGSPRRKEIMELLELTVEIVPSTFEENLDKALFETLFVMRTDEPMDGQRAGRWTTTRRDGGGSESRPGLGLPGDALHRGTGSVSNRTKPHNT
jgi:hypothetical protein